MFVSWLIFILTNAWPEFNIRESRGKVTIQYVAKYNESRSDSIVTHSFVKEMYRQYSRSATHYFNSPLLL